MNKAEFLEFYSNGKDEGVAQSSTQKQALSKEHLSGTDGVW